MLNVQGCELETKENKQKNHGSDISSMSCVTTSLSPYFHATALWVYNSLSPTVLLHRFHGSAMKYWT